MRHIPVRPVYSLRRFACEGGWWRSRRGSALVIHSVTPGKMKGQQQFYALLIHVLCQTSAAFISGDCAHLDITLYLRLLSSIIETDRGGALP